MSSIGKSERGASLAEYAIALGILVIIFVLANSYLRSTGDARTQKTLNISTTALPCESGLSADQCL